MCLKNKIIAATLCAFAAIGIFAMRVNTVNATNWSTSVGTTGGTGPGVTAQLSVEQLQQIVLSLQQQIQQLIQMIAQMKPLETCGNGFCRFGETAATCAADCGVSNCIKRGQIIDLSDTKKCCEGLIPLNRCFVDGVGAVQRVDGVCDNGASICGTLCGNGKCETGMGETSTSCAADCGTNEKTGCLSDSDCAKDHCGLNCVNSAWAKNQPLTPCPLTMTGMPSFYCTCQNRQCTAKTSSSSSINVSANALPSNYVYAGNQNALVYSLNILANGSNMDVQRVTLQFSGAPYDYFSNIYLYNGSTLLASSLLNTNTVSKVSITDYEITLANFTNKFVIPNSATGQLAIKVDVRPSLTNVPAKIYVSTVTNGVRAVDQSNLNVYGSDTNGPMIIVSQSTICGNGKCDTGETAINCATDCQNNPTCKTLWWSDNTSKICQQNQFCGSYMYLGLKTYNTQSDCQKALDATCSQECVAKGYALGGNYCVANSQGILESCCCSGSVSKCDSGNCETGGTGANFIPISIVTTSTPQTTAAPASLTNTFNVQITAKNGDVYLPREGAFTVAVLKDNQTDLTNNHIGTVYNQPTGTVVVGNSYKIPKDVTVTFSATANYSTTISGYYHLQMAIISWSKRDGDWNNNWAPTITSLWDGQAVYLQGNNSPVCGNGVCDTGENSTSCPADCYGSAGVEFFPASITTSSVEATIATKAAITGTFNIRVTAKNADAYIPKTGAFTVAVLKDNETDATKSHIGSIYTQPAGTIAMGSSYKIPANTTATFTPTATYSTDTAGSYRLQMFIVSWAGSDGGMIVDQILSPSSIWTSPSAYLKAAGSVPTCNNGYCDNGETASSCPRDCACRIMAFYAEPVTGYAYNNVYLDVINLPAITPITSMTLNGVDTWNGLTFSLSGAKGLASVLKANQTVNNQGFTFMNERTSTMTLTVGNTVCGTSVPNSTQVSMKSSPISIAALSASLNQIIQQYKALFGK